MRRADLASNGSRPALVVLCLILVMPVALLGGVHPAVQTALLVGFVGLMCTFGVWSRARSKPFAWHPLVLVPAAFAGLALLQLVPLPIGWVGWLSPAKAAAIQDLDALFGVNTRFTPLTCDIAGTARAAIRWWLISLGLLLLAQLSQWRRVRQAVPLVIMVTGAVVLLVGVVQFSFEVEGIYGLFEPWHRATGRDFAGSFVNLNHAAHYYLLGAMSCLALLMQRSPPKYWKLVLVLFVLLLAGMMLTHSRGAMLSTVVFSLIFSISQAWRRRWSRALLGMLAVAVAFAALGLLAFENQLIGQYYVWEQLGPQLNWDKVVDQVGAVRLFADFGKLGMGADAFGSVQVFMLPRSSPSQLSFVEIDLVQLTLDYGLFMPIIVVASAVLVARRLRRRMKGRNDGGDQSEMSRSRRRANSARGRSSVWGWWLVIAAYLAYGLATFSYQVPALVLAAGAIALAKLDLVVPNLPGLRGWVGLIGVLIASLLVLGGARWLAAAPVGGAPSVVAHARASREPFNGRNLWASAIQQREGLRVKQLDAVALATRRLAGNDIYLLGTLAAYWSWRQDLMLAWDHYEQAWGWGMPSRATMDLLLEGSESVELLVQLCEAYPARQRALLEALGRAERHHDQLAVALRLPDSAMMTYFRVLASHRMGEHELSRGLATGLQLGEGLSSEDCRWIASALRVVRLHAAALEGISTCLEHHPTDLELLVQYLQWALASRALANEHSERIAARLESLNHMLGAQPGLRLQYYRLLAMHHAALGHCAASALALAQYRRLASREATIPAWVTSSCP